MSKKNIINGKELSNILLDNIKKEVSSLGEHKPKLVIIQVGDNLASSKYIKHKLKACAYTGIIGEHIKIDENITQQELINKINQLNNDAEIDGIIVQLPLPNHIDSQIINETISANKDVDGFSPLTLGKVLLNTSKIFPATPLGILKLLEWKNINLVGANVVIIGRSNIVGKPLANMLINKSATVTICNTKTKNLAAIAKKATILISAAGSAKLITKEYVNKKTILIDVGANFIDGGYCGDVDFEEVSPIVKLITPVPGGVGPMTIACLLENTLNLYKQKIFK